MTTSPATGLLDLQRGYGNSAVGVLISREADLLGALGGRFARGVGSALGGILAGVAGGVGSSAGTASRGPASAARAGASPKSAPAEAAYTGMVAIAGPTAGVTMMLAIGLRDEAKLTNVLFWAAHPEMTGKRIAAGQRALAADWVRLRDTVVRPALRSAPKPAAPKPGGAGTGPSGPVAPGPVPVPYPNTTRPPAPTGPAPTGPTPTTPHPTTPTSPSSGPSTLPGGTTVAGGTLRDSRLAELVASVKHPTVSAAADELAAIEERSRALFADKKGHSQTEEKGAGRDQLVEGIAKLRGLIADIAAAGLPPAVAGEITRRMYLAINEVSPFYAQSTNTDLLEGKEQAKELGTSTDVTTRTCNITSLGMALEALGKSPDDYTGNRAIVSAVAAAFKPEVAAADMKVSRGGDWGAMAGLRMPDFLQLAAIAEQLKSAAASQEQILAATRTAWSEILGIFYLEKLAKRFGVSTATKPFTLDPSKARKEQGKEAMAFKGWAKKYRTAVEKMTDTRNQMGAATGRRRDKLEAEYAAMRKKLAAAFTDGAKGAPDLAAYKQAVLTQIAPELEGGAQVEVSIAGHYVRLQAIHDDHLVIDDPARAARANRKVTWEEARAMGYFNYRLVLTA
ncbi:MAG: hypothetical protein KY469_16910 [Actinobacteria bacterium]|nr:hypothetical protein [Actinomycetota bacterium]